MSLLRFVSGNLQVCAVLGFYAAYNGTFLRTFSGKTCPPCLQGSGSPRRILVSTFIGPCIANTFSECNQQDATFHNLFISVRRSTCFGRFFRPWLLVFLFNTVIYVFLLLCLCILIVCLCIFIVPAGTLRLP